MRYSKYIDFETGVVKIAPMDLKNSMALPLNQDQKIDLFECRLDVWTLGVAVAMLKQIDQATTPSVWQHAAYGLLTVSFAYFEMIGKTLNPTSAPNGTASEDFNVGFCDVYPAFTPKNGIFKDKILPPANSPSGTKSQPNPDIQDVIAFRDRSRNGLYHLGYTKSGLWIHNDNGCLKDFEIVSEHDPVNSTQKIIKYRINPHRLVRTLVNHFPSFVARIRTTPDLKMKFIDFFDQILSE